MDEEYELDDLGVPILDDLGVPKLKAVKTDGGLGWRGAPQTLKNLRDDLGDVVSQFNRGATEFVPAVLKTAGAVEGLAYKGLEKLGLGAAPESLLSQAGETTQQFIEKANPVSPEFEQSTGGQVVKGVGQVVPFLATMGGSGGAQAITQAPKVLSGAQQTLATGQALARQATSAPGVIAGSQIAAPEWEAAKAAGLSDEEAFSNLVQNYFVGQTEVIPIQNVLSRLNKLGGGKLFELAKSAGVGGFQEAVQEGFQTYLTNKIAEGSYDPDRDPLFQVLESAKIGGLVGMFLPVIGSVVASPEVRTKLDKKVIELEADKAISETDSGDQTINNTIDVEATQAVDIVKQSIPPVEVVTPQAEIQQPTQTLGEQLTDIGDAIQKQEPTEVPVRETSISSEEVREGDTESNLQETTQQEGEQESFVKPKQETVTMTLANALKKQIKDFYRGVDKGVRKGQDMVNENLIPKVQEAIKNSNLSPVQTNAIINKLKRTNLFTPGSYSRLQTYIDNVVGKADYAEKIEMAEALQAKIKAQAKSKGLPQNIKSVSKEFAKLDVENFKPDDYIQLAEHVSNNLTSPKGNKYTGFDEFKVAKEINKHKREQDIDVLRVELGELTDEEVDAILDQSSSVDDFLVNAGETRRKQVLDRLRVKADYAKLGLENVDVTASELDDSEQNTVNTLLSADTSDMSADDMVRYIRAADNITLNNDFSGTGVVESQLKAKEHTKALSDLTKGKKGEIGKLQKELYSLGQLLDVVYNNNRTVADFETLTGVSGILEAGSSTNNTTIDKANDFRDVVTSLNKKYKGVDIRDKVEQFKLNLLGVLARTTDGSSHLPKVKANIERSIELYRKVDEKLAKTLQQNYDKYKDVKSSDEVIEKFKKSDPKVYEAWKWFQDNLFTPDYSAAVKQNTNNLYNKTFIPEQNYWPYSQKRIDSSTPDVNEKFSPVQLSLKPQQSANTLEATRSLAQGHAYALDAFGNVFKAYKNTLYDINSAKSIQLLHDMTKRPEFESVIGGLENKNRFIDTMKKRLAEQYGKTEYEGEIIKMLNDVVHVAKDLGTAKALGGLDQIVSQTIPTWIAASINLGSDANLMFSKTPDSFVKGVIGKKTRTSEAGRIHGGTDLGDVSDKYLSNESENKLYRGLDNLRRATSGLAHFKLKPLTVGDVFVRRKAFTAFYLKRLAELGVDPKTIDLETESEKQGETVRQRARVYADHMISTLQVPSNRAEMAELLTRKGGWDTLRTIVFPFSTFPLNTKIRLARAIKKVRENPSEGGKELAGVLSESVTFAALKTYLLAGVYYPLIQALLRSLTGTEPPDESEPNQESFWYPITQGWTDEKDFRKVITNLANDISPFALGMGQSANAWLVNNLGYAMRDREQYGDYTIDEWMAETKGVINKPYENDFSGWGVVGVGAQQLYDVGNSWYDGASTLTGSESIYYDTMFGPQEAETEEIKAETEEIKDLIYLNSVLETASIFAPREFNNAWQKVYKEQLENPNRTKDRTNR